VLRAFLNALVPNARADASLVLDGLAEAAPDGPGRSARLFAVPVLVHPDDGRSPDNDAVARALVGRGLLPASARVRVAGAYADAKALSSMAWSTRRAALLHVLGRGGRAAPPPEWEVRPSRRGVASAILCAVSVLESEASPIGLLGDEPDRNAVREVMLAVLNSGGGIVDVGAPTHVSQLGEDGLPCDRWLVEGSGVLAEIEEFAGHARAASPDGSLASEVRPVPGSGREVVRLHAAGTTLDERCFDTRALPLAPGELRRLLATFSDRLSVEAPLVIDAIGERGAKVPQRHPLRATVVQGGKHPGRVSGARDAGREAPASGDQSAASLVP
jgi:hypothetical protein